MGQKKKMSKGKLSDLVGKYPKEFEVFRKGGYKKKNKLHFYAVEDSHKLIQLSFIGYNLIVKRFGDKKNSITISNTDLWIMNHCKTFERVIFKKEPKAELTEDNIKGWVYKLIDQGKVCVWAIITQDGETEFPRENEYFHAAIEAFIQSGKQCWKCKKLTQGLKVCSKCKRIFYCSKDCQVEDWQSHKPQCKKFVDSL